MAESVDNSAATDEKAMDVVTDEQSVAADGKQMAVATDEMDVAENQMEVEHGDNGSNKSDNSVVTQIQWHSETVKSYAGIRVAHIEQRESRITPLYIGEYEMKCQNCEAINKENVKVLCEDTEAMAKVIIMCVWECGQCSRGEADSPNSRGGFT